MLPRPSFPNCKEKCLLFLEDISPFCGAADTSVLDFLWHLPWVLWPGWISSLYGSLPVCNGFLRFTSSVTLDDVLAASMWLSHVLTHIQALVGWNQESNMPLPHSVCLVRHSTE